MAVGRVASRRSCSRSRSPRCRWSSATARCASSRPSNETREGFELATKQVPPGEAAPLLIVVDADGPIAGGQAALDAYARQLKTVDGVTRVEGPIVSDDGKAALIKVVAAEDPEAASTLALIDRLRAEGGRASGAASVGAVHVGGYSAQQRDFIDLSPAHLEDLPVRDRSAATSCCWSSCAA